MSYPAMFSALTTKLNVPGCIGVPEITPAFERVKPFGKLPPVILHVMGVVPAACNVWLYATPTVPFGRVVVVIVGGASVAGNTAVTTPLFAAWVLVAPATVKVFAFTPCKVKPAVGVRVITAL